MMCYCIIVIAREKYRKTRSKVGNLNHTFRSHFCATLSDSKQYPYIEIISTKQYQLKCHKLDPHICLQFTASVSHEY